MKNYGLVAWKGPVKGRAALSGSCERLLKEGCLGGIPLLV